MAYGETIYRRQSCTHYDYHVPGCYPCKRELEEIHKLRKEMGQKMFSKTDILKWKMFGILVALLSITHLAR